ncbi:MAG: ABC transporter permease [Treponema sp.]|nr:ABC transporter permease [Treponema sp.]
MGKKSTENKKSFQLKLASKAHAAKYKKANPGPAYAWPMGLWFTIFFVVPILIIVCYSFMKRDMHGGVQKVFTFGAYKAIFTRDSDTGKYIYLPILLRTLWMTVVSTIISIVIALPCGYAIARSKKQTLLLVLVIIPFLTNSLIRIFAWQTIMGEEGLLNQVCHFFEYLFHLNAKDWVFVPHKFMYTKGAVIVVSIYMYLPYAILPIFTAVDRFDFSLIEAARDLGAKKRQAMIKILLPGIKSGIISSLIFVFIPIFGNYTVPQLVGSTKSYMLGNVIMDQIQKARNLPLASAFSVVLTLVSMAAILFMITSDKKDQNLKKSSAKEDSGVPDSNKVSSVEQSNKTAEAVIHN